MDVYGPAHPVRPLPRRETNDQAFVPYWDAMMAAQGVKGYARYAP